MKFTTTKKVLEMIINKFIPCFDNLNPLVAFKGMLFNINDSFSEIIVSNGNISAKMSIENINDFKIEKKGIALIPHLLFRNIIKKTEGMLSIENNNNILMITNNDNIYTINCYDEKDYPRIDFDSNDSKVIELDLKDLKKLIKNTSFATSQTEFEVSENKILTGINFKLNENILSVCGTNKYRLSMQKMKIENNENFDITIPSKNIKELISVLSFNKVILNINENKIAVKENNFIIQSNIFNLPFNDLTNIFPKNFSKKIIINAQLMQDNVDKSMVILSEKNNILNIYISKQKIIFYSSMKEAGSIEIKLDNSKYKYESPKDEEINIFLSAKYLKEALNTFEDNIIIYMDTNKSPILITSENDSNNLQLISLIRN